MVLKPYLPNMQPLCKNLKWFICMFFLAIAQKSTAQVKADAGALKIIVIAQLTKDHNILPFYYFEISGKLYSGGFFKDYNINCRPLSEKDLDSIYKQADDQSIETARKKIEKSSYAVFNTKDKLIDTNFYWKCYSVKAKYIKLNCRSTTQDLFEFYNTTGLSGIQIISFDVKSLTAAKIPGYITAYLLKHKECVKVWKENYRKWEDCMERDSVTR